MVEYIPIGSFTIFTNTNSRSESYKDEKLHDAIANAIVEHFESRLKQFPNLNQVFVADIQSEVGCIITAITLGAIATAGGGIYVFVKDYDKIKSNLQLIISDFKNAYLRITKKKKKLESQPDVEFYSKIPDDLKKYYNSGQDVVFYSSEKETIQVTKICIMKDNLVSYFEEKTIKSQIIVLTKKSKKVKS